mmetsp:Transcript_25767/g.56699  ORF Transcript_25767/g.56699 Transcript_25767/m.56699 type:complete len:446 (-) Transcript_25767:417-1754(-)
MWISARNNTRTSSPSTALCSTKIASSVLFGFFLAATVSVSATDAKTTIIVEAAAIVRGNGPCSAARGSPETQEDLYAAHPVLCWMLDRIEDNAEAVAVEMTEHARTNGWLVGENLEEEEEHPRKQNQRQKQKPTSDRQLPVVFAHGMGDSCFNSGMIRIGNHTSDLLGGGVYVVCVPTGDTQTEDTTNGYFLSMDKSVDVFAERIAADPRLRSGFHAVGFSQGNNVIRGYIARYNTPTVHTFLSINGVNAGEGTVPGCFPDEKLSSGAHASPRLGSVCDLLLERASDLAYTEFSQEHSFQSNYWRDPRLSKQDAYHQYSQLARWNNEGPHNNNQTLKENYSRTSRFVWVMATEDGMVWPHQGEHWGCPNNSHGRDPFASPVLPMNETEWYREDLFGLKTAQEAGKNVFETFEGDHLQFTMEDYDRWITSYLSPVPSSSSVATAEA